MAEENKEQERKVREPRDVTKRPPSIAASGTGPKHTRAGKHGIRTTAETVPELQREGFDEAQAEDFERSSKRTTGAGPNPYGLAASREAAGRSKIEKLVKQMKDENPNITEQQIASFVASAAESKAADAEVQTLGATVMDTGLKIVEKPDRVDAQDKAVLPKAAAPHEEAIAESDSELAADKNPGAIYGGTTTEQVTR